MLSHPDGLFIDICHLLPRPLPERCAKASGGSVGCVWLRYTHVRNHQEDEIQWVSRHDQLAVTDLSWQ